LQDLIFNNYGLFTSHAGSFKDIILSKTKYYPPDSGFRSLYEIHL